MAKKDREMAITRCLSTLKGSGVVVKGKAIERGSYGMGTWAAIDCLVNYHGYHLTS